MSANNACAMLPPRPLVSVCIANYNGMGVIDECIRSVKAQKGDLNLEILVHDDASTDGSADYIRSRYPSVKLIRGERNVGFCISNNRMAAAATGDYFLLLNNDAALFPDALQTLVAEARRSDGPVILTLPQYDATTGALVDRGCLLDPFFNPIPNLDPQRTDVAMVIGACLWIPRSLWVQLEGFPDWFGSIAEDMYLCCRARLAGYAVHALPTSGYRHWQGNSFGGNKVDGIQLSTTYARRALSERNKTFVMLVTLPLFPLMLLLPLHLLALLLEAVVLTVFKRSGAAWRKIYAPLFPALWATRVKIAYVRRSIQSQKTLGTRKFLAPFLRLPWKLRMLSRYGLPHIK